VGPDPAIPDTGVQEVLGGQARVMQDIVTQSGVQVTTGHSPLWCDVARFGMNYVDQKCDVYMNDLFVLNSQHDRNDSLLKTADKTGFAIVEGVVSAAKSRIPLLLIAQGFGLLQSINDAATKTYLFEQIPGIVADKVTTARLLYRQRLQDNQRPGPNAVDDEASAIRSSAATSISACRRPLKASS
jgi:hypothetical protein